MERIGNKLNKGYLFTESMFDKAMQKSKKHSRNGKKKSFFIRPPGKRVVKILEIMEKKPDDYFYLLLWHLWCLLLPFLRQKLKERSTKDQPYEFDGKELFKIFFEDGVLKLCTLDPSAAELLGLSQIYTFQNTHPYDAYSEMVCKFH